MQPSGIGAAVYVSGSRPSSQLHLSCFSSCCAMRSSTFVFRYKHHGSVDANKSLTHKDIEHGSFKRTNPPEGSTQREGPLCKTKTICGGVACPTYNVRGRLSQNPAAAEGPIEMTRRGRIMPVRMVIIRKGFGSTIPRGFYFRYGPRDLLQHEFVASTIC